jgi:hypothetical protein
MTRQMTASSIALAVLIGVVHTYLLLWAWIYIGLNTPLPRWLVMQGITGASYQTVLFSVDFLTNMLLCIPAAYLLCKLSPHRLWLYLLLAVVPGFLWQYRLVLADIAILQNWQIYLPGVLLTALPLPTTSLLVRRIANSDASKNSFKSNPVRGSA